MGHRRNHSSVALAGGVVVHQWVADVVVSYKGAGRVVGVV